MPVLGSRVRRWWRVGRWLLSGTRPLWNLKLRVFGAKTSRQSCIARAMAGAILPREPVQTTCRGIPFPAHMPLGRPFWPKMRGGGVFSGFLSSCPNVFTSMPLPTPKRSDSSTVTPFHHCLNKFVQTTHLAWSHLQPNKKSRKKTLNRRRCIHLRIPRQDRVYSDASGITSCSRDLRPSSISPGRISMETDIPFV